MLGGRFCKSVHLFLFFIFNTLYFTLCKCMDFLFFSNIKLSVDHLFIFQTSIGISRKHASILCPLSQFQGSVDQFSRKMTADDSFMNTTTSNLRGETRFEPSVWNTHIISVRKFTQVRFDLIMRLCS